VGNADAENRPNFKAEKKKMISASISCVSILELKRI
jgi:hypothetical protein